MKTKNQNLNWFLVILIAAFTGLLAGCASVAKAPSPAREQALSFKPPSGHAGLYIICPKNILGSLASWDFCLDQQKPASLRTGSFGYTPILPGEHILTIPEDEYDNRSVCFTAKEGQNYFITVGACEYKSISAEAGESDVRQYWMSGNSIYQLPFVLKTSDSTTPVSGHVVITEGNAFISSQATLLPPERDLFPPRYGPPNNLFPSPSAGDSAKDYGVIIGAEIAVIVILVGVELEADHLAHKKEEAQAHKMNVALQKYGLGETFRTNIQSSLATAIAGSPWLHTTSLDLNRGTNITTTEIDQHSVMQINLSYNLAPDASFLFVHGELHYFRKGETNAAYDGHYTYISEPLPITTNKTVVEWNTTNATLLRERLNQGISELLTMMDIDFFHPGQISPGENSKSISYWSPIEGIETACQGIVLRSEGPRIVFQYATGNLFSLPGSIFPIPIIPSIPPR